MHAPKDGAVADMSPRSIDAQTDDPIGILHMAVGWRDEGFDVALATLTEVRVGAARALGAMMAIRSDGLYCGQLSGGCLEGAVATEAMSALVDLCDRDVLFGRGSPDFDIALPCGGGVTVNIHCVRDPGPLASVVARHAGRQGSGLRYLRQAQSLALETEPGPAMTADATGFVRRIRPRTRLLISGSGLDAQTTSALARAAGYDVTAAARGMRLADHIDAQTAVIILHHDLDAEIDMLGAALSARPFYIGALGSRATHARRCERLLAMGYGADAIARIKAPIGLVDRARDAPTLALSILADIAATQIRADDRALALPAKAG